MRHWEILVAVGGVLEQTEYYKTVPLLRIFSLSAPASLWPLFLPSAIHGIVSEFITKIRFTGQNWKRLEQLHQLPTREGAHEWGTQNPLLNLYPEASYYSFGKHLLLVTYTYF